MIFWKSISALFLSIVLLQSAAKAEDANSETESVPYTYLGMTSSLAECQIVAGDAGFRLATWGGYVNGIYYVYACFGSYPRQPSPDPWGWQYIGRAMNADDCSYIATLRGFRNSWFTSGYDPDGYYSNQLCYATMAAVG